MSQTPHQTLHQQLVQLRERLDGFDCATYENSLNYHYAIRSNANNVVDLNKTSSQIH